MLERRAGRAMKKARRTLGLHQEVEFSKNEDRVRGGVLYV